MTALSALAFDIQGTAVDFHGPILRMGAALNAEKGLAIDWTAFSSRWRALYREAMDEIIAGRRSWTRVDRIYRDALDELLPKAGLAAAFSADERDALNAIWTRLEPWPDTIEGLTRLSRRYTLTTLSNAGMAAVIAVVKRSGLPFDAVLTAELARAYKPDPSVYRLACEYLDLPPDAIMMVACHEYDLRAARAFGMRTAFVARPLEFGPGGSPAGAADGSFDIAARDFNDLAAQLGA